MKIAISRQGDSLGVVAVTGSTFEVDGDRDFLNLLQSLRPAQISDQAFALFLLIHLKGYIFAEVESFDLDDKKWFSEFLTEG